MTQFDFWAIAILSVSAAYDYRYRIIPDWSVGLIFLCGICKLVFCSENWLDAILACLVWGTLTLMFGSGGDGKLCAALGLLMGFTSCALVLILALILFLLFALLHHEKSLYFAPFLLAATLITYSPLFKEL